MAVKPCNWTRELELDLVEFCRTRPYIWKSIRKTSQHVKLKYEAYAEFAAKLGQGFTARHVRDRWSNIRRTFNLNLRQVEKSKKTAISPADVYIPCWFLWEPLQFLKCVARKEDDDGVKRKWTKKAMLEFIKLYKTYPQLWNTNSVHYNNKEVREVALRAIKKRTECKSIKEVQKKIRYLKKQYHGYLRRKLKSESKGIPFKESLYWFQDFKEIMDTDRLEQEKQNIQEIILTLKPELEKQNPDRDEIEIEQSNIEFSEQKSSTSSDNHSDKDEITAWSKNETRELIKLYKSYPQLWNTNSCLYKNKQVKKDAIRSIQKKMKCDSIKEIKRKIKNLRCAYHRIKRKKFESERKGIPYKVIAYWFHDLEEVMDTTRHVPDKQNVLLLTDSDDTDGDQTDTDLTEQKSSTTFDNNSGKVSAANDYSVPTPNSEAKWHRLEVDDAPSSSNEPSINEDLDIDDSDSSDQSAIEFSDQKSSIFCDNNNYSVFIKSEPGDDNFEQPPLVPVANDDNVPTPAKSYRLKVEDDGAPYRPSINEIENNEFQIFANSLAEQLRMLPLDKALHMQLKIQKMVAEERTKQYHKCCDKTE